MVSGAGVLITMLPTAEVILEVVEPLLPDWPEDTVWLQMSSVGAAEADQLAQVAEAHGVRLVDAPVSGSTHPAEEGELTILASGPDSARTAVEPVFGALASRVLWVGEAGMGSRLKLAANHWMITMVAAWPSRCTCARRWGSIRSSSSRSWMAAHWAPHTRCRSSTRCAATSTRRASPFGSP